MCLCHAGVLCATGVIVVLPCRPSSGYGGRTVHSLDTGAAANAVLWEVVVPVERHVGISTYTHSGLDHVAGHDGLSRGGKLRSTGSTNVIPLNGLVGYPTPRSAAAPAPAITTGLSRRVYQAVLDGPCGYRFGLNL